LISGQGKQEGTPDDVPEDRGIDGPQNSRRCKEVRILPFVAGLAFIGATNLVTAQPIPTAVITDPPQDKAYPAKMQPVAITSHGSAMHGVLYLAAGAGPHPTLLLLHGFPGNEQNLDIAQSARRTEWNVCTFHYRGAWGSDGAFSFSKAIQDAETAIAFLRDPAHTQTYRIEPTRIAVAGHSMGGFIAAYVGAKDPTLVGIAMISAWNCGARASAVKTDADHALMLKKFAGDMDSLTGCTPESLYEDAMAHRDEWNFVNYAPALASRPLLLVTADDGNRKDSDALAVRIRQTGGSDLTEVSMPTDHSYRSSARKPGRLGPG
jgi:pimeloyl-ACP methyl ester carboxylesterase